ncbi:hypothetical protein GE061_019319 [Apolygus lucorum]|uniref:Sulfatase N-terminal domain-containing protein n=1 Tax=Apolygus lucorum TaxID=248454 RepID=A0A8S9X842_APOLU|nr:hypothetical protein GE061_019319 [Apolygus lucorum]
MGTKFGSILLMLCTTSVSMSQKPSNIVILLADDMGWNDVGIHGSEVPTPNLDALAYNGIVLRRHYAQPSCTPSRAALLTGHYPIRHGVQGRPFSSNRKEHLPLGLTLMPQILKRRNYRTHLVGKWHLGYTTWEHMPTRRGFDSFYGYLNGFLSYYDGIHFEPPGLGLDFWSNETESWPLAYGAYLPELLGHQAEKIIKEHNKNHKDEPLFLLVAANAPHAGGDKPFQADFPPSRSDATDFIKDPLRRNLADVMRYVDDTLGNLTATLKSEGMLDETMIMFLGDNGGPSIDPNYGYGNAASNYPFRGTKMSVFDGGVRAPAILWKSGLDASPRVYDKLFHMVDWLPTLNSATGGDALHGLDGVDQWAALTGASDDTPRNELLVEIYDQDSSWGYLKNNFKYVKSFSNSSGNHFTNNYWSPHSGTANYRSEDTQNSLVAQALGAKIDTQTLSDLRNNLMMTTSCTESDQNEAKLRDCSVDGCLFDISKDPSECYDVSEAYPDVKKDLIDRINSYLAVTVIPEKPSLNVPNCRNFFAPSSAVA